MFNNLMKDRITIRSADGKEHKDVPASVQRNKIFIEAHDIQIRPGDQITRQTSVGVDETFIVEDPGFFSGVSGIPANYQMRVRRADSIKAAGGAMSAKSLDALTGLLMRGEFDKDAQQGLAESLKLNQPFALVMADADHFKDVNDTHGHQTGDAVLREIAIRLIHCVAGKGQVYRYGGEEMVILLPNHSVEEALAVAERCRKHIEHAPISELQISMSFGVACAPDHAPDVAQLFKAADVAVYQAKDLGRNLVRFSGEPAPTEPEQKQRQPARKAAQAGQLTEAELAEIRRKIMRREAAECPKDQAILEHQDITSMGDKGRRYLIHCPDCGLAAEL